LKLLISSKRLSAITAPSAFLGYSSSSSSSSDLCPDDSFVLKGGFSPTIPFGGLYGFFSFSSSISYAIL